MGRIGSQNFGNMGNVIENGYLISITHMFDERFKYPLNINICGDESIRIADTPKLSEPIVTGE